MPEILEQDWVRIQAWRQLTTRQRRVFSISGTARSGKTVYLEAVRDRMPEARLIDCSGLSADAVASSMRGTCRTAAPAEPVVLLLANVQYAGTVLTSTEPARVAGTLAQGFRRFGGREVWVMAEHDPELMPPLTTDECSVTLSPPPGSSSATNEPPTTALRLAALAAAEQRRVPLAVWQMLCASAGTDATAGELLALARHHPDVVVTDDGTDRIRVGFPSDELLHTWRRHRAWDADMQAHVVDSLLSVMRAFPQGMWPQQGPVGQYAAAALPLHAALAGRLERVLEDGKALAQCARQSVLEASAAAWPDGVPYSSVATLVHYLEVQGVDTPSQGEWVAWLHHAALCAGRTELADQLLASGVDLPWQTVWSHWRPMGVFGQVAGGAGRVDELGVTVADSQLRAITARDMTTGMNAYPKPRYVRQEWDPTTGASPSAGTTVQGALSEGDWNWISARTLPSALPDDLNLPVTFARHTHSGWSITSPTQTLPPRCPPAVTQGICFGDTWVLAGTAGLFAVRIREVGHPVQPPFRGKPLVAAHSRVGTWPLPDRAATALQGVALRQWLEETFGAGSCHRLGNDQLPDALSNQEARRFLMETGLPEISGLLHLSITPRGDKPLREVRWPGRGKDVPRHTRAKSEPPSDGPFYELGDWMYSRLLLDGTTGRLFRDTTGGMAEPLAGSSLLQYFAMVRLFDEFRRTHHPYDADHKDAESSLRAWCRRIDGAAAHGEVWAAVLEGYDFEDSTWDLAFYGDEWV